MRPGFPSLAFSKWLVRLYPLYALGLALAFSRQIAALLMHRPDVLSSLELSRAGIIEAAMLPDPWGKGMLYPLNGQAWSLFCELAINLVFALFLW